MTTSETGPSELREYLSVLWRRRYLIALTILVTLGAAIFYTQRQTPLYRSSAQVLVTPISLPLQGQQSYASVNMSSEQLVAASPEVAQLARQQLAADGIAPGDLSVESSIDDLTLTFSATSPQPLAARSTAEAYAEAYLDHRSLQLQQDLQDGEDSINAVITDINGQIHDAEAELAKAQAAGDDPRATVLQLRITSLSDQLTTQQTSLNQILLAGSAPVGHVIAPAYLPTSPSSPDVQRNRLLGVLLGISLGVGLAFLVERLDEGVRLREDVEASTGAPLIARIPAATMPEAGPVDPRRTVCGGIGGIPASPGAHPLLHLPDRLWDHHGDELPGRRRQDHHRGEPRGCAGSSRGSSQSWWPRICGGRHCASSSAVTGPASPTCSRTRST